MTAHSPALRRVLDGDLCSGCGGCAAIAPDKLSMTMDRSGFLRPVQTAPLAEEEEARLNRVCPGIGQTVTAGERHDDPLWGPYVEMTTGHATDEALRFAGASGGVLSALSRYLLATGTVDRVVTNIPDPENPVGNVTSVTGDPSDLPAAAGSRYAPSAPLAVLASLRQGPADKVAFIGKPCDVAALQALRAEDPDLQARIPLVLSFFCAGVPSVHGGSAVLRALGCDTEDVTAFRYRGNGWPGRATATLSSGESRSMTYHESWGGILADRVQFRCKVCADGTGKAADIVAADAWDCDDRGYPLFDERAGQSLIVARTEAGQNLLSRAAADGALVMDPFDVATLDRMQPGQSGRRKMLRARLLALRVLGRPVPRYRGLNIQAAARMAPLGQQLRNFLGTLRRVIRRGSSAAQHKR